jgi:hypothetical protein
MSMVTRGRVWTLVVCMAIAGVPITAMTVGHAYAMPGQCVHEVGGEFCCDCDEHEIGTCGEVTQGYWACGNTWCPDGDSCSV